MITWGGDSITPLNIQFSLLKRLGGIVYLFGRLSGRFNLILIWVGSVRFDPVWSDSVRSR